MDRRGQRGVSEEGAAVTWLHTKLCSQGITERAVWWDGRLFTKEDHVVI